jgi:hypothetical protein
VARISNLPWDFRRKISVRDPLSQKVSLAEGVLGSVAKISGQELSLRSGRLFHAVLENWAPTLKSSDCKYSSADLEKLDAGAHVQLDRLISL